MYVTQVSLYRTVKTICVAMLLIELQSPTVSVGNTIRTQMFHDESTRSKQINQVNILAAKHLKRHCLRKCSRSKKWGSTDFLQTYPRGYTWSDITKYTLVLFSGILL